MSTTATTTTATTAATPWPITALASTSTTLAAAAGPHIQLVTGASTVHLELSGTKGTAPSLVRHLAVSHDGAHIAAANDDKAILVYTASGALISTRHAMKKASDLRFAGSDILYSDKVGDVYLYPLHPAPDPTSSASAASHSALAIQSDPTLNPDASLVLGHVSIVSQSVITPDGRYIITADRDEHIRVSRYPDAHIIERFLFGSSGFVSAIHVVREMLVSAGGERWLRLWNWREGKEIGRVDIMGAVLPHRRARAEMRPSKKKRTEAAAAAAAADADAEAQAEADAEETFCTAPDGWLLPAGQGVCVKKISSVDVDGETIVLFFSEGAAAIHWFALASPTRTLHTLPLPFPVLDFCSLPIAPTPNRIIVSLDTAYDTLKQNSHPRAQPLPPPSPETRAAMQQSTLVLQVSPEGLCIVDSAASSAHTLPSPAQATDAQLAKLDLYPNLSLMPRWFGFEEDEGGDGRDITPSPAGTPVGDGASDAGTAFTLGPGGRPASSYTPEELAGMSKKQLGRLKSKGVDVASLMWGKKKQKQSKQGNQSAQAKAKPDAPRKGMGPGPWQIRQQSEAAAEREKEEEAKRRRIEVEEEEEAAANGA